MTAKELPAKWQAWSSDLMANPAKNYTLTAGLLGAEFVAARLTVAVIQYRANYSLGWDIAMLLALGFGFFRCAGIVQHLYGYISVNATDDETFPREHRLYWRALRTNLIIIYCGCALMYPLGIAIAAFSFHRMGERCKRKLQEEYLGGTRLASVESVNQRHLSSIQRANGQCFWFGGAVLPRQELVTHFKIMGSTRSGKTTLLRLYMRSVLSRIGTFGCEDRALLYDPKSEFYPFLRGMGIPEDAIFILNPFDARACAWDIARDFPLMRHASSLGAAPNHRSERRAIVPSFFMHSITSSTWLRSAPLSWRKGVAQCIRVPGRVKSATNCGARLALCLTTVLPERLACARPWSTACTASAWLSKASRVRFSRSALRVTHCS